MTRRGEKVANYSVFNKLFYLQSIPLFISHVILLSILIISYQSSDIFKIIKYYCPKYIYLLIVILPFFFFFLLTFSYFISIYMCLMYVEISEHACSLEVNTDLTTFTVAHPSLANAWWNYLYVINVYTTYKRV